MKVLVEIDLGNTVVWEDVIKHKLDWFPTSDKKVISIDNATLKRDPKEDSFFLFRLISIVPEELI